MAKKRSASTTTSGAQSGPAAKKPPGPKQSKSSTRSKPVTPDAPMIDTSAAARAAAAMLLHRDKLVRQRQQKGSLVEQIKSELSRPHAATVTNILNQSAPDGSRKPSALPFGQKQVGHNQTFGADLTRSGVPRRTSG